ncbi:MAG: DUF2807 domain-containing protein [Bacteroidota bacterium]
MKTSNLIAGIGAAMLFTLSLLFQGRVHYYIKKERAAGYVTFESQSREVAYFDRMRVKEKIKVVFSQDSITSLRVHGPKELLDSIKTNVIQNTLQISLGSRTRTKDTIKVFVNTSTLNALELAGGYFENTGMLMADAFYLKMDKNSDCNLNLSSQRLEVDMAKESGLDLKGKTGHIIFINQ